MKYTLATDRNGNRVCRVKPPHARGFAIQTNGNLPETHRHGIHPGTPAEVSAHVADYGTDRQKQILNIPTP